MAGEAGPEPIQMKGDGYVQSNADMRRNIATEKQQLDREMVAETKTTNRLLGSLEKHLNNLNNTSREQHMETKKLTRRTAESGNIITA